MKLPGIDKNDCIWEFLARQSRPVIIYGTGNGADKIIDILMRYGVSPSAVFASDTFVRHRTFRGMPVKSYDDIVNEYGNDIVILLAFGSALPEIAQRCRELADKHTFLIPEVPLYDSELFTFEYYESHKPELQQVMDLLADNNSKLLLSDMIMFRLTGKPEFLERTEPFTAALSRIPDLQNISCVLDAGAYTGDTAKIFASMPGIEKVIALEPDPRTFRKLEAYADSETHCKVIPVNCAAYDGDMVLEFSSTGGRGAGLKGSGKRAKTESVRCMTIDSIANGADVDIIKYDVEGDERRALLGSAETIARCRPSLIVSLYHRTEDIFALPLMIKRMLPSAKFYMSRIPCIPAWDLTLFAISG